MTFSNINFIILILIIIFFWSFEIISQSVPQPLLPNNLVFPYPQSPPARSVYGSEYGMPITAEVSRTIGYGGISREQ